MNLFAKSRTWGSLFSVAIFPPARHSRRFGDKSIRTENMAAEYLEVREVMSATSTAAIVGPQQQITGASIASSLSGAANHAANLSTQQSMVTVARAARDLAAVSVTAPSSAQWGSEFAVTVQIKNNGSQQISNYQYGFTLNTTRDIRQYQLSDLQTRNVTLRPGETDTFTAYVRLNSASTVPYTSYLLGLNIVAENRDPTGNNQTTSSNRMTIQAPTSIPVDRFDAESNNSKGQANFIKQFGRGSHSNTFYGSTGSGADTQDWFRFRVDGATSGSITLSGMTRDLDLELYNSAGTRIARSALSGTATDSISLNNLGTGDYYVRVSPYGSGSGSAYALRFGLTVR